MQKERLKSYKFNCPCCKQGHNRLFEYYAKFYGPIPENQDLEQFKDIQLIERVVSDEPSIQGNSIGAGDSTFRCSNCYEFFKFDGSTGDPRQLFGFDKKIVEERFEPIPLTYEQAVMNSLAMLDELLNKNGCVFDERTGEILITRQDGKEYSFGFADSLVKSFYGENKNYEIRGFDNKKEQKVYEQEEAMQKIS